MITWNSIQIDGQFQGRLVTRRTSNGGVITNVVFGGRYPNPTCPSQGMNEAWRAIIFGRTHFGGPTQRKRNDLCFTKRTHFDVTCALTDESIRKDSSYDPARSGHQGPVIRDELRCAG